MNTFVKFALAIFVALLFQLAPASAGHYIIHHHWFHIKKPPVPPTPKPDQPRPQAGGSNFLWGQIVHGVGDCLLVGHGVSTFIAGEIEKRKRTDKDQDLVFASCTVIGWLWFWHQWGDGKRVPQPLWYYSQVNTKPAGVP